MLEPDGDEDIADDGNDADETEEEEEAELEEELHRDANPDADKTAADAAAADAAEPPCAPLALGDVASELEEKYAESAPFVVDERGDALAAAAVKAFASKPGDEALLAAAAPLCFRELTFGPMHPQSAAAHAARHERREEDEEDEHAPEEPHPLLSLRMPHTKQRRHHQVYRNYAPPARASGAPPLPPGTVLLKLAFFVGRRKHREIVVHAGQRLDELLEVLHCPASAHLAYQEEELAKRNPQAAAERPPPSAAAALCIEDEWYVRGPNDLSSGVRGWLAERRGQAAPPEPRHASAVTFGMLTIRLGRQYLYVHHGDCEHALVFTECWLASEAEEPAELAATYPRVVFQRANRGRNCSVCMREPSVWEVHGDRLADSAPCHLCDVCHFQMHYDAQGRAHRTDYKIYPVFGGQQALVPGARLVPAGGGGGGGGGGGDGGGGGSSGLPPVSLDGGVTFITPRDEAEYQELCGQALRAEEEARGPELLADDGEAAVQAEEEQQEEESSERGEASRAPQEEPEQRGVKRGRGRRRQAA